MNKIINYNVNNKNLKENFEKTVKLRKSDVTDKVLRRKNIYDKSKPRRYVRCFYIKMFNCIQKASDQYL